MPEDNIVKMLHEVEARFGEKVSEGKDGEWRFVTHPAVWFAFTITTPLAEYRKFLRTYVWSTLRKKLYPWLLPWEETQALIMKDALMQLYSDYEVVEIEWRKKEAKDVQE